MSGDVCYLHGFVSTELDSVGYNSEKKVECYLEYKENSY